MIKGMGAGTAIAALDAGTGRNTWTLPVSIALDNGAGDRRSIAVCADDGWARARVLALSIADCRL